MCVIIDANCVGITFSEIPSPDSKPVLRWIDQGNGRLVVGGKLMEECAGNLKYKSWLKVRLEAGKARRISDEKVDACEQALRAQGQFRSNDSHVVALAVASGARLLFSRDQNLHQDFTNAEFISEPRGKIYQTQAHSHLLRDGICRGCT